MAQERGAVIPGFPEKLRSKFLRAHTGSGNDHKPLLILTMLMRLRNEGVEATRYTATSRKRWLRLYEWSLMGTLRSKRQRRCLPIPSGCFKTTTSGK